MRPKKQINTWGQSTHLLSDSRPGELISILHSFRAELDSWSLNDFFLIPLGRKLEDAASENAYGLGHSLEDR